MTESTAAKGFFFKCWMNAKKKKTNALLFPAVSVYPRSAENIHCSLPVDIMRQIVEQNNTGWRIKKN